MVSGIRWPYINLRWHEMISGAAALEGLMTNDSMLDNGRVYKT